LPERQFIRLNADAIIRPDINARYTAHEKALRNGWLNRDEVREIEHREPISGGDGKEYNWPPYSTTKAAPAGAGPVPAVPPPGSNGNGQEPAPSMAGK
jgi:hypothetical protein